MRTRNEESLRFERETTSQSACLTWGRLSSSFCQRLVEGPVERPSSSSWSVVGRRGAPTTRKHAERRARPTSSTRQGLH